MLKLDLSRTPHWLDFGHGVRLHVEPLTSALMMAARNDPAVEARRLRKWLVHPRHLGMDLRR